jgi:hypothetical protein
MEITFQFWFNEYHSLLVPTFGTAPRKMVNGHANTGTNQQANNTPPANHPRKLRYSMA